MCLVLLQASDAESKSGLSEKKKKQSFSLQMA